VAAAGCLQRQAGLIGIGDGIGGDASSTLMPSDAHVDVHFLSIKTMGHGVSGAFSNVLSSIIYTVIYLDLYNISNYHRSGKYWYTVNGVNESISMSGQSRNWGWCGPGPTPEWYYNFHEDVTGMDIKQ